MITGQKTVFLYLDNNKGTSFQSGKEKALRHPPIQSGASKEKKKKKHCELHRRTGNLK